MFYNSFDLFPSETNIYYTKNVIFFVGSSRPPYTGLLKYAIRAAFNLSPKFVTSVATLARRRRDKIWKKSHHRREQKIARVAAA